MQRPCHPLHPLPKMGPNWQMGGGSKKAFKDMCKFNLENWNVGVRQCGVYRLWPGEKCTTHQLWTDLIPPQEQIMRDREFTHLGVWCVWCGDFHANECWAFSRDWNKHLLIKNKSKWIYRSKVLLWIQLTPCFSFRKDLGKMQADYWHRVYKQLGLEESLKIKLLCSV